MTYLDSGSQDMKVNCPITYTIETPSDTLYDPPTVLTGTSGVNGEHKYQLKTSIRQVPGVTELVIKATALGNSVTKTFTVPIELKRLCNSNFNSISTPATLNAPAVPASATTPPAGTIGKTWQERMVGDDTIGFEFE